MKKNFVLMFTFFAGVATVAQAQTAQPPLRLIQTIPLPGVPAALDHMGIDVRGQRLFIPAEQHQTIEVVDLKAGKRIRTLSGALWPNTIAYNPSTNEIFVTDRSDSSTRSSK